jgi:hypothetical protein
MIRSPAIVALTAGDASGRSKPTLVTTHPGISSLRFAATYQPASEKSRPEKRDPAY